MTSQSIPTRIKLTELIAPSFYDLYWDITEHKHTHYKLAGGRGSTKSSFISIMIVLGMMSNPDANAMVLRKVGRYLEESVFEQLLWAIEKLGVEHLWKPKYSPLGLTYLPTGQRIVFRGADEPKKIKSVKLQHGYFAYTWYEERDEFDGDEEERTINQSLMRGGDRYWVFYSWTHQRASITGSTKTCCCRERTRSCITATTDRFRVSGSVLNFTSRLRSLNATSRWLTGMNTSARQLALVVRCLTTLQ